MKRIILIFIFLIGQAGFAFSQAPQIRTIRDDLDGFAFEVSFPLPAVSEIKINNITFTRVSVPGMSNSGQAGEPSLPLIHYMIGIPEGPFRVKISSSDVQTHTLNTAVVPVPEINQGRGGNLYDYTYQPDKQIYALSHWPQKGIVWTEASMLKNQRVLRIFIAPGFYYPASRQLSFHGRIRVSVSFDFSGSPGLATGFEGTLKRLLLNYENARRFRIAPRYLGKRQADHKDSPFQYNRIFRIRMKGSTEFMVNAEGLYKVSGSDLEDIGSSISGVDIEDIRMYAPDSMVLTKQYTAGVEEKCGLREIPIVVVDVNDNGQFDRNDQVRFFGFGNSRFFPNDSDFTFQNHPYGYYNYFWLVLDANALSPARRFDSLGAVTQAADTQVTTFMDRVHREDNKENPTRGGKEYRVIWAWRSLPVYGYENPDGESISGYFTDIATSHGSVHVRLMTGGGDAPSDVSHLGALRVRLNNKVLNKKNPTHFTFPNLSISGPNYVEIGFDQTVSSYYLDWYEVIYERKLKAYGNALIFYGRDDSGRVYDYALSGFSSADRICLDVSDPMAPRYVPSAYSSNTLRIRRTGFVPSADSLKNRKFCVLNPAGLRTVTDIEAFATTEYPYSLRHLHNPSQQVEYLIIAPYEFYEPAKRLAEHRTIFTADAVREARVVFVEDIYNHFSGGKIDISAIRNFLFYAANHWHTTHAVLLGGGHRDFKGYLKVSQPSYIPPYQTFKGNPLIESPILPKGGASDDFFSEGSGSPTDFNVYLGRLPVSSVDEAFTVVEKIIIFDIENLATKIWKNRVVFLADDDYQLSGIDGVNQNTNHMKVCEDVAQRLPPSMEKLKVYLQEFPVNSVSREKPDAERDLVEALSQGVLAWIFVGHGGFDQLTDEKVFTLSRTLPRVKNYNRCGLFWAASCEVGQFDNPSRESICLKLLAATDIGMIATVGASRETHGSENRELLLRFVENLFVTDTVAPRSLGHAMRNAKIEKPGDNSKYYNLFGDPAMHMYPRFGTVTIDSVEKYDTLQAMEKLHVTGRVTDVKGERVNGTMSVRLISAEQEKLIKYTYGKENDNIIDSSLLILAPGYVITSNLADLRNGSFTLDFMVPKNIPFMTLGSKLSFFSWYRGKIAEGCVSDIYFSGEPVPIDPDSIDKIGPAISVYLNSPENSTLNFEAPPVGENLTINRKSIVTVLLEDKDGIQTQGKLVNEGIMYEMVGLFDRRRITDVRAVDGSPNKKYFNLIMDTELFGITQDLTGREYDFIIMALDNYDNRSKRLLKARFADDEAIGLTREEVYAYPNPFKKNTRFMWGSTGRADVVVKIYTQSGKLIKVLKSWDVMGSTAPGAECVWDGCDEAGNPVGRGVYFYKMIFNLPETGKEEETEEEKTVEEAPVIGKLMKL